MLHFLIKFKMNTVTSASASAPATTFSTKTPKSRSGNSSGKPTNYVEKDTVTATDRFNKGEKFKISESMLPSRKRIGIKTMLGIKTDHEKHFAKLASTGTPDNTIIDEMRRLLESREKNALSIVLFTAVQAGKIGKKDLMSSLLNHVSEKLNLPISFLIETVFVDKDIDNVEEKGFNFLSEIAFALRDSCVVWLIAMGANLEVVNSYNEGIFAILLSGLRHSIYKGEPPKMVFPRYKTCCKSVADRITMAIDRGLNISIEVPEYEEIGKAVMPKKMATKKAKALDESKPVKKKSVKKKSKPVPSSSFDALLDDSDNEPDDQKAETKDAEIVEPLNEDIFDDGWTSVIKKKPVTKKSEPVPSSSFAALSVDSDSEPDEKEPEIKKSEPTIVPLVDENVLDDGWSSVSKKKKTGKKSKVDVVDFKNDGAVDTEIDRLLVEFNILVKQNEAQAFVFIHEELKKFPKDVRETAWSRIE